MNPACVITELDYFKLSPEESLKSFLERSAKSGRLSSVDTSLARLVDGTLGSDIRQDTLQAGFVTVSPDLGAQQSRVASGKMNRYSQVTTTVPSLTSAHQMAAAPPMLGETLTNMVQPRQVLTITAPMSTVVPAILQPEASSRETSLNNLLQPKRFISEFNPAHRSHTTFHAWPTTFQAISTTTGCYYPHSEVCDSFRRATVGRVYKEGPASPPSARRFRQPTAAAQSMSGQGIASLFQPQ